MSEMLEGTFTALVTPFHRGEIDWEALERLVEFQIRGGVNGLVPCGTTGESATLSPEEQEKIIRFIVDEVAGRVPVVAGTGANATRQAVENTRRAQQAGADAALVVTPYYNKPGSAGLVAHYREVAEVGLPVILYNVPSRTGVCIDLETYRRLARIPGVVATKEASGSLPLIEGVLADGTLRVLSGDDATTFPLLCLGACGVISVTSNLVPRWMTDLCDHAREGQVEAAREEHRRLLPLMNALFLESNPAPVKAALAHLGLCQAELRLPLTEVGEHTLAELTRVVDQLEIPARA